MDNKMIWSYFMGISHHMWKDGNCTHNALWYLKPDDYEEENKISVSVWDDVVKFIGERQYNMLVIDLGDGVRYDSHPEISAPDAWSKDFLKQKILEARAQGLEVIPKLNFSCGHDTWLKEYRRMVSTPIYYKVCADLIKEVCELFDYPRLFHLGLDEEDERNQKGFEMITIRGEQLFWHDAYFFFDECAKHGARPWVWSDYCWAHPDVFAKKMPTSVLQSNWYYGPFRDFAPSDQSYTQIATYEKLDKLGYDQIPTCCSYRSRGNARQTVAHGKEVLDPSRLKGFISVPWIKIEEKNKAFVLYDADFLYQARKEWYPETLK